MKLKFKTQDFQTDAVNAVCDLFAGQQKYSATFSMSEERQQSFDLGVSNALLLDDSAIIANMHSVQKRHNLPQTSWDSAGGEAGGASRSFCVEMETGTGKTYVYTKTIFELNQRYGFTKFIIVVPSVAIREGVYKSFEITREHFALAYSGVATRFFIYNSAKLSDVRQFATSANIEIMIINIDAFKKAENIINQSQDRLNGESAMRYIQDTNPVVIIDEPQSVDSTDKAKEAIASLNPLCVFRYSATHREKINTLYRLTPVDAYQMGLVKQICVSSNTVEHDFNKPYIRLLSVSMDNGFSAKIELDILSKNGKVERKTKTVKTFTDLHILSGQREMYEGYVIESIDCTPGREQLEFSNLEIVPLGKAIGGVDENLIKRAQIKRTIEAHLDKELRYHGKGIKVLSLFFIDEVKKYRTDNGGKGVYAEMFEECYNELMALEKYAPLRNWFPTATDKAHDGYFSQDKKGNYKNTKGDALDDYNTYNTIMRDKEWLLSFDCPLRFIFSHSALKEGWDNPNVFQVCTLIEQKSTFTCRQKVGRGLRLCVNQDGERIEDKDINLLHVMANESFAEFAETLQKEIEQETGMKFGILQLGLFSGMTYTEEVKTEKRVSRSDAETLVKYLENKGFITPEGNAAAPDIQAAVEQAAPDLPPEIQAVAPVVAKIIAEKPTAPVSVDSIAATTYTETVKTEKAVTYDDAKELIEHFEKKGYVSKTGKIKDTMKAALLTGTLDLPAKFEAAREKFETIISRANRTPPIRDASRDVVVKLKHQVVEDSPEFAALWERICQRTTYRVNFDHGELVRRAVRALRDMPPIPKARMVSVVSDIDIQHAGVTHTEREIRTADVCNDYATLPNILTIVSDETLVPRTAVNEILQRSGRVGEFFGNPRMFIESFIDIVRDIRHSLAVDGISYVQAYPPASFPTFLSIGRSVASRTPPSRSIYAAGAGS